MDKLVSDLSPMGLAILAVTIVVFVDSIKRFTYYIAPALKARETLIDNKRTVTYGSSGARFWNEIVLYLLPYFGGCLCALVKNPLLFGTVGTYGGRFFVAVFVATFSATFYKAVKKVLPKLFNVEVPEDNDMGAQ